MNYYDVLGVKQNSTEKEIKSAYKKLVKKYHPDVFKGNKEFAENKIKEFNEAYEVLSNSEARKEYDDMIAYKKTSTIAENFKRYATQNSVNNKSQKTSTPRYEDLFNNSFYKRYTTNYYGVSRDDLKHSYKNVDTKQVISPKLAIISGGIIAICLIIISISLLSSTKSMLDDFPMLTSDNTINSDPSYYYNDKLPYVELNMTYRQIKNLLGSPDNIKNQDKYYYAYWGNSYIVFDENNLVVDWQNNGDFSTDTYTGMELLLYQEIYNWSVNQNT